MKESERSGKMGKKLVSIVFRVEGNELEIIKDLKKYISRKFNAKGIDFHVKDLSVRGVKKWQKREI